jgi:hypothetical protein
MISHSHNHSCLLQIYHHMSFEHRNLVVLLCAFRVLLTIPTWFGKWSLILGPGHGLSHWIQLLEVLPYENQFHMR